MFKVSFKRTDAVSVRVYNKVTEVILKGSMQQEVFIPRTITEWMASYQGLSCDSGIITVGGIAKCAEEDTFDPVIGRRIAEARAKIKLYRFMVKLLTRIYEYYKTVLYGNMFVIHKQADESAPKTDSLEMSLRKYIKLYRKEIKHLVKLLKES